MVDTLRVGLIDVDSKIPNLALMKISAWHKSQGDKVSFYQPIFDKPDLVYASKIFKYSTDNAYWPQCEIRKGGSGYDLNCQLPPEIEKIMPDYSLYNTDYAIGFTSRGCIRNCGFCIVPQKEGRWHAVGDIYQFWRDQKYMMLLDGNLTADHEHFMRICKQLVDNKVRTFFSQGLDLRLMDVEKAKILSKVRDWDSKRIHFAWDNMSDEQEIRRGIEMVTKYINPHRINFYVLIGWDTSPDEDLYRVEVLKSYGTMPFVMPYDKFDNYQKHFTRWVNMKQIFMKVPWPDTDEYKKVYC